MGLFKLLKSLKRKVIVFVFFKYLQVVTCIINYKRTSQKHIDSTGAARYPVNF